MNKYILLLRSNPGFALLWSAQIISLTGDWFNTIVLSTLVARFTDGSGLAVSLYLMARFLPPLIVGPFAGVLVDRFDRQRILVFSNIARTGVVLFFLFAMTPDHLWLIYFLTILQFILSALFEPGQSAITPSLVPREDLVLANTLSSITWSAMLALGAIIGGIVAAIFGAELALVFDALTFALAAGLIAMIKFPEKAQQEQDEQSEETGSLIEGLRHVIKNPATSTILMIKGGGSIGNIDTLITIYATQVFIHQVDSQLSLGIMFSAFGLGAVIGPLILNHFHNGLVGQMSRLIIVGFACNVLGWLLMGTAQSLVPIITALIIRGIGSSSNWTYSSVIIQKTVPDRYLGRIFSLDMAVFQLITVISIIVHGAIIDLLTNNARLDLFLRVPEVIFHADIPLRWGAITTSELSPVAWYTAAASFVPLVLWTLVVIHFEYRKTGQPADIM